MYKLIDEIWDSQQQKKETYRNLNKNHWHHNRKCVENRNEPVQNMLHCLSILGSLREYGGGPWTNDDMLDRYSLKVHLGALIYCFWQSTVINDRFESTGSFHSTNGGQPRHIQMHRWFSHRNCSTCQGLFLIDIDTN